MKKKNTQEISKVRVCVCVVSLVHKRNTQKKKKVKEIQRRDTLHSHQIKQLQQEVLTLLQNVV